MLLDYLFSNNGRVPPAMLQNEEKLVKEMYYDPTHSIDVIFNKVKDLSDLSVAARANFTELQLINIAYVILNTTEKTNHILGNEHTHLLIKRLGQTLKHTPGKLIRNSKRLVTYRYVKPNLIQQILFRISY